VPRRKPQPGDDPEYLAWLRGLPCVFCLIDGCGQQRFTEAMHIGRSTSVRGLSRKYPDREAVPGCRHHHDEHHEGTKTFWVKHPEYKRDELIKGLNLIYDTKRCLSRTVSM
jgi:hypothetical protein